MPQSESPDSGFPVEEAQGGSTPGLSPECCRRKAGVFGLTAPSSMWFTPWTQSEDLPESVRSVRCRPESPVTQIGVFGVKMSAMDTFCGGVPPTSSQGARPEFFDLHCCKLKSSRSPNPSTQTR